MTHAEHPFDTLVSVMAQLRGENGCPWDKEQTHRSLLRYLIEESYEVVEAVESGSMEALCEELGDLLLQVVFHAQMAREVGAFDAYDVVHGIVDKMIRRHPHVFGDARAETASDVMANWEAIKRKEKEGEQGASTREGGGSSRIPSQLDGISRHLPALLYAEEAGRRAAKVGFDWPDVDGVFTKLHEEIEELRQAYIEMQSRIEEDVAPLPPSHYDAAQARIEEEWGDLAFTLVNLARHLRVQPELAARRAAEKFIRRFRALEKAAAEQGTSPAQLDPESLDRLWEKVKAEAVRSKS